MSLGDLIEWLERLDPKAVVPFGFAEPMSYRGDYYCVAFEPAEDALIGDMLRHAKSALGATFSGYKGGEYKMDEYSECYVSPYGQSGGDRIGPTLCNMWEWAARQ